MFRGWIVRCVGASLITGALHCGQGMTDDSAGGGGSAGSDCSTCSPGGSGGASGAGGASGSTSTGGSGGCLTCATNDRLLLHDGWTLQSSSKIQATGQQISTPGFATQGWYPVTVPATVLAGLDQNKAFGADLYFGTNLQQVSASQFGGSYWYRTEVKVPTEYGGKAVWLDFDGINYKANVWLNGQLVASSDEIIGTFRTYEKNVTSLLHVGEPNALAVEVFAPDVQNDLALSWVDWNPPPPDRNMGLWHDVYLKKSGPVAVRGTHAVADLDVPSLSSARVAVAAELHNATANTVHVTVQGTLAQNSFSQDVDLAANESKAIKFDPAQYPALRLANPRVWWPAQWGAQEQYDLTLQATIDGQISDSEAIRFGIRKVTLDLATNGARLFHINGKPILIRGGGWASDMMLRASFERLKTELAYVKDIGLNTIRLEGKLETDEFFAQTDAAGILVMPGWMCCDRWEHWSQWTAKDREIAQHSMQDQANRLRNHPSVIDFLIGSDNAPPADIAKMYVDTLTAADWPNPISAAASDQGTMPTGPSGFKMTGPYDWIAPLYWSADKNAGGAFGFNSETGPGAAIPEMESLNKMLAPAELTALWSQPQAKQYHAGAQGLTFDNLSIFNAALKARHGAPESLDDYVMKAQLMSYEAERAEFEAYRRNRYTSTGVIHWMLNNGWPSLIWHLYGHDLLPSAGYFGAKKANEPVHVQYSYDDRSVVLINETQQRIAGLTVGAKVYNLDASSAYGNQVTVDANADSSARVMTIPALANVSATYFVALTVTNQGKTVSSNYYWISRRDETLDWANGDWFHTPTLQYADFTALSTMPQAKVDLSGSSEQANGRGLTHVTVKNSSPSAAFFVRLRLTRGQGGDDVLPVFWEDNYLWLAPGEQRTVTASYDPMDLGGASPSVEVRGWNVAKTAATL